MNRANPKIRVFIDADVLFAGSASPSEHSASQLILTLSEISLIETVTSRFVLNEVERNLIAKIPATIPAYRHLVSRCIRIVDDPDREDLNAYAGLADPKDLPVLVSSLQAGCTWLATFNLRHFQPGHPDIQVVSPGQFIQRIRQVLTQM